MRILYIKMNENDYKRWLESFVSGLVQACLNGEQSVDPILREAISPGQAVASYAIELKNTPEINYSRRFR